MCCRGVVEDELSVLSSSPVCSLCGGLKGEEAAEHCRWFCLRVVRPTRSAKSYGRITPPARLLLVKQAASGRAEREKSG